jgi:predicted acyltransferase
VFGRHLWSQSKTWDPEGLLSTVPAVATTLLGLVTGLWLASSKPGHVKAAGMAAAGAVALVIGWTWGLAFPINKNLWTSSYVWFMGGMGAMLLAACYWLIDVRGWKRWAWPFVVLGLNAITLFVGSGLLVKTLGIIRVGRADGTTASLRTVIYQDWFVPLGDPYNASLYYALANLAVMFAILYVMYRRQWFLKV